MLKVICIVICAAVPLWEMLESDGNGKTGRLMSATLQLLALVYLVRCM